jgi:hypothetical protein
MSHAARIRAAASIAKSMLAFMNILMARNKIIGYKPTRSFARKTPLGRRQPGAMGQAMATSKVLPNKL